MPEKLTKEEAVVAHTINQLRLVKELIKKEKVLREAEETKERMAYDSLGEEVKVKRPKAKKAKVTNKGNDENGFGSAGETVEFQ